MATYGYVGVSGPQGRAEARAKGSEGPECAKIEGHGAHMKGFKLEEPYHREARFSALVHARQIRQGRRPPWSAKLAKATPNSPSRRRSPTDETRPETRSSVPLRPRHAAKPFGKALKARCGGVLKITNPDRHRHGRSSVSGKNGRPACFLTIPLGRRPFERREHFRRGAVGAAQGDQKARATYDSSGGHRAVRLSHRPDKGAGSFGTRPRGQSRRFKAHWFRVRKRRETLRRRKSKKR